MCLERCVGSNMPKECLEGCVGSTMRFVYLLSPRVFTVWREMYCEVYIVA